MTISFHTINKKVNQINLLKITHTILFEIHTYPIMEFTSHFSFFLCKVHFQPIIV